ncbi:MAG TPA: hypothetical protein VHA82_14490 [Ramlibacter sp.]|uniref:hypothetical protein n=1 Tax=Ramlibacter sp. TaxID=1917967 RepID=UPI002B7DA6B9|nr:hypothetical protein [Ramlibacter sp.]HVZ45015.1 hypothetical protein [Ramlibacter sp.]
MYAGFAESALQALRENRAADALRSFRDAARASACMVAAHECGGPLEAPDEALQPRVRLTMRALGLLEERNWQQLVNEIDESPTVGMLRSALYTTGGLLSSQEHHRRGREISQVAVELDTMLAMLSIEKRAFAASSDAQFLRPDRDVRTAMTEVFGVAFGPLGQPYVNRMLAVEATQQAVRSNLQSIVSTPSECEEDFPPGVDGLMWHSLGRADYTVNGLAPIDRATWSGDDATRWVAMTRLADAVQGNATQLRTLSRIANERAMNWIGFAMPDGREGMLLGRRSMRFDIRQVEEGGLRVRCTCAIPNATHLLPAAGSPPVTLRKGMSAACAYDVLIRADGSADVIEPLSHEYDAEPDEWSASHGKLYPKPDGAADLHGAEYSWHLRSDLREYCDNDRERSGLAFLDAAESFAAERDPSRDELDKIMRRWFESPSELEISEKALTTVRSRARAWGTLTAQERQALFAAAVAEVRQTLWRGPALRLLAALN